MLALAKVILTSHSSVSAVSHGAALETELRHLIVQVKTLRVPLRYKIKSLDI